MTSNCLIALSLSNDVVPLVLIDLDTSAGSLADVVPLSYLELAMVIPAAGDDIRAYLAHYSWSCDALLLLVPIDRARIDAAWF